MLLVVVLFIVIIGVINGRQVVSFKKNLEQVMNKKICKEPQQRLVYLGTNSI